MEPNPTPLPECRRYITTHNSEGKAVIHSSPTLQYNVYPGLGGVAHSYSVGSVPAILKGEDDVKRYLSPDAEAEPTSFAAQEIVVRNKLGSNLCVIDLLPGAVIWLHQTVSIDFSICVLGNIDLVLDSGEVVHMGPSDHIVQRATMHKWVNPSKTESARLMAVTLPCEPFEVAGKLVEEIHNPPEAS